MTAERGPAKTTRRPPPGAGRAHRSGLRPLIGLALAQLLRAGRAGELRMVGLALVVAVGSLTSVAFFVDRVDRATELRASELLAADRVVQASQPFDPDFIAQAQALGLRTARTVSFRSVVTFADKLELAEVKAVQSGYPLRGRMQVAERLFAAPVDADRIPPPGTVWPDARLLQALAADTGARIGLGQSKLRVDKALSYEPDRGGDIFNIAPRLLMNLDDLDATELLTLGSRASYRLLLSGADTALAQFRTLVDAYPEYTLRGLRDARPELRAALQRAEQFLGLAVLISLALAGLAIALAAQRYATRQFDQCAIMRCFGASTGAILKLHLIQLLSLALLGSIAGCVLGYLGQAALAALMQGLTARPLPEPGWRPLFIGLAAGLLMLLGFAMPQLLRLKDVPALRTLRRNLDPLPVSSLLSAAAAALCLLLLAPWQAGGYTLVGYGLLSLLLTGGMALLAARLMLYGLNALRSKVGVAARFGLANVVRRARLSMAQILALSLGVMALTLLILIRADLLANWQDRLPPDTPNYFLSNIPAQETAAIQAFMAARAGIQSRAYPLVRARLTEINGRPVQADDYQSERARRFIRRAFNLSAAAALPSDNLLVQGEWWDGGAEARLFSFEEDFARELGLELGDRLSFQVAEQPLSGTIANTRQVDWDTFNVNFFVLANPGTLADAPRTYLSSFYLPPQHQGLLRELVAAWPSIAVFDVDAILIRVRSLMQQVIRAVEFVCIFTLLAGLIVLLTALQTTHDERQRETALLIALGATRRQALAGLLAELALLGLVAGLIATLGAGLAQWLLAGFVFGIDRAPNPLVGLLTPILCVLTTSGAGLWALRQTLNTPPVIALRSANE